MAIQITYQGQSIANFIDKKDEENEDSILMITTSDQFARFVICDGAGGAGVFSRDWAKFLSNSIPETPFLIADNSKEWFIKTAERFHDNVITSKNLSDLVLNKKVYNDGSYSTFCVCWIDTLNNKIYYAGIGDTIMFTFLKTDHDYELKWLFPIENNEHFNQNPELVNWIIPLENELPVREENINNKFNIVIASDNLANWIILNIHLIDPSVLKTAGVNQEYLNSLSEEAVLIRKEAIARGTGVKSISGLLEFLSDMSKDELNFREAMKILYENGEVEIDDYSLINIEGDVS